MDDRRGRLVAALGAEVRLKTSPALPRPRALRKVGATSVSCVESSPSASDEKLAMPVRLHGEPIAFPTPTPNPCRKTRRASQLPTGGNLFSAPSTAGNCCVRLRIPCARSVVTIHQDAATSAAIGSKVSGSSPRRSSSDLANNAMTAVSDLSSRRPSSSSCRCVLARSEIVTRAGFCACFDVVRMFERLVIAERIHAIACTSSAFASIF